MNSNITNFFQVRVRVRVQKFLFFELSSSSVKIAEFFEFEFEFEFEFAALVWTYPLYAESQLIVLKPCPEVALFLKNKGRPMAEMEDESWLCDLAFLVDITTYMNELNTRLQQKAQYVSEMYGHIKGFMKKLRLWLAHIQNANLSHFSTLKEMGMRSEKKTEFADQLEKLFNELPARFESH